MTVDLSVFVRGTMGGLPLGCRKCGFEVMREPPHFKHQLDSIGTREVCSECPEMTPLEPQRLDERESVWYPLWLKRGYPPQPGSDYERWRIEQEVGQ